MESFYRKNSRWAVRRVKVWLDASEYEESKLMMMMMMIMTLTMMMILIDPETNFELRVLHVGGLARNSA